MTDLVARLRADAATWHANCHPADLQREAADEIERLREKLNMSMGMNHQQGDEIIRLRETLHIIWVAYQDNDGIRKIFTERSIA